MSVVFTTQQGTRLVSDLPTDDFTRIIAAGIDKTIEGHPPGQPDITVYANTQLIVEWVDCFAWNALQIHNAAASWELIASIGTHGRPHTIGDR